MRERVERWLLTRLPYDLAVTLIVMIVPALVVLGLALGGSIVAVTSLVFRAIWPEANSLGLTMLSILFWIFIGLGLAWFLELRDAVIRRYPRRKRPDDSQK